MVYQNPEGSGYRHQLHLSSINLLLQNRRAMYHVNKRYAVDPANSVFRIKGLQIASCQMLLLRCFVVVARHQYRDLYNYQFHHGQMRCIKIFHAPPSFVQRTGFLLKRLSICLCSSLKLTGFRPVFKGCCASATAAKQMIKSSKKVDFIARLFMVFGSGRVYFIWFFRGRIGNAGPACLFS